MMAVYVVGGLLLGASSFWLRGSAKFEQLTGRGKTTGDLVWAALLGAFAMVGGLPWEWSLALVAAFFAGGRLPWWGSLDMGTMAHSWGRDLVVHSARGLLWTLAAGLVMWFAGGGWQAVVLAASGLLAGPAWALGFQLRPPGKTSQGFPNATEVGELVFGGIIGVALALAVLQAVA